MVIHLSVTSHILPNRTSSTGYSILFVSEKTLSKDKSLRR